MLLFYIVHEKQEQAAEDLNDALIEQEGKTAEELAELKVALEQAQGQAKLAKAQLEQALNKQKVQTAKDLKDVKNQAAKELSEVKAALERSHEQAKVSLHDQWWWKKNVPNLYSFFYSLTLLSEFFHKIHVFQF